MACRPHFQGTGGIVQIQTPRRRGHSLPAAISFRLKADATERYLAGGASEPYLGGGAAGAGSMLRMAAIRQPCADLVITNDVHILRVPSGPPAIS